MSTILSASAAAQALAAQSRRRRLIATLRRWWAAYMARRLQLAATRQLKAMSDRELKDIGISRSQIESAVFGASHRDRVYIHSY